MDLGDRYSGCTLHGAFTTIASTGAPIALAGTPAPFLVARKDATTCSQAGLLLARDCQGALGFNTFEVRTNSDATFYSCGHDYILSVVGGTVDGTCVSGYVIATFSLKNRAALLPTISGRQLDVSAGGEAGVDWANVGSPTTAVGLSCTTTFSVTSVTNAVNANMVSPTVSGIACTVWNETRARFGTCGTFGYLLDCAVSAPLRPSTQGRTLDVSTGGEAGLDWANIGSPQTVQRLGCTSLFEAHRGGHAVTALSTP